MSALVSTKRVTIACVLKKMTQVNKTAQLSILGYMITQTLQELKNLEERQMRKTLLQKRPLNGEATINTRRKMEMKTRERRFYLFLFIPKLNCMDNSA